jgi:low affinity Fe/Cu permease
VFYARITSALSAASGHPLALAVAIGIIVVWAIIGPFAGFSETWQLVINTSTTIITFLMVFIIQSSQNRDTRALHIKLDELIRINSGAKNALLNLEDRSEAELMEIQTEYKTLAQKGGSGKNILERASRSKSRRKSGKDSDASHRR